MFKLPGRSAQAALRAARRLARGKGRTRALILGVFAVAVCVLAVPVYAERSQSEGLAVYLRGGVSPRTLPRDHPSPGLRAASGRDPDDELRPAATGQEDQP